MDTVPQLWKQYRSSLTADLYFDLNGVERIDSAGVAFLLATISIMVKNQFNFDNIQL